MAERRPDEMPVRCAATALLLLLLLLLLAAASSSWRIHARKSWIRPSASSDTESPSFADRGLTGPRVQLSAVVTHTATCPGE